MRAQLRAHGAIPLRASLPLAALAIGVCAWLAGADAGRSFAPRAAAPGAAQSAADKAPAVEWRALPRESAAALAEPLEAPAAPGPRASRARARDDYGLPPEERWQLERYRSARDQADRAEPLLELALSDAPGVLPFLLDELRAAPADDRAWILAAVVQYGSHEAAPELRALADRAPTPDDRAALLDAADFLSFPNLPELRTEGSEGS